VKVGLLELGTAEFAIDVSAVDAQAATGGVRINFIPRDGGNRYSGKIFGSYAGEDFVSDNFTGSDVEARLPQTVLARVTGEERPAPRIPYRPEEIRDRFRSSLGPGSRP